MITDPYKLILGQKKLNIKNFFFAILKLLCLQIINEQLRIIILKDDMILLVVVSVLATPVQSGYLA